MCVVSMIGDVYKDKWKFPGGPADWTKTSNPDPILIPIKKENNDIVTRKEFEALKKEVEDMKILLERAIEYDKRTNQSHCEQEEKIVVLKKVAELVGVDLSDILK